MCPKSSPIAISLLRLAETTVSTALLLVALAVAALAHAGSVYVPVDSWLYPATERLAALTGSQAEVMGMRPWTRAQFAHFLERAREKKHDSEAAKLQSALEHEFAPELDNKPEKLALESIYTRSTQIGGTPLRDSFHFGQTIVNDFGRPYGQGFNTVDGGSGYLQERAGLLYVRGEYQHGASLRTPSPDTLTALAKVDLLTNTNTVLTQGGPEVNNPRLLDTYVGVSFAHFTGTLGKQSLWWGPATGGAMLYSNNIEPIWMARLTNDVPYKIPVLGNARIDLFYGKLQGHTFVPQSWIHGEKLSLQPFKSIEFGFSRTVVFLGDGFPFTLNRLVKSYTSVGDNLNSDLPQNKVGDRRGGLDFSWKLPKIPVTLYSDGFCDDDPSPLAAPTRSAFHPGLYIARLPGSLAKLANGRLLYGFGEPVDPQSNQLLERGLQGRLHQQEITDRRHGGPGRRGMAGVEHVLVFTTEQSAGELPQSLHQPAVHKGRRNPERRPDYLQLADKAQFEFGTGRSGRAVRDSFADRQPHSAI